MQYFTLVLLIILISYMNQSQSFDEKRIYNDVPTFYIEVDGHPSWILLVTGNLISKLQKSGDNNHIEISLRAQCSPPRMCQLNRWLARTNLSVTKQRNVNVLFINKNNFLCTMKNLHIFMCRRLVFFINCTLCDHTNALDAMHLWWTTQSRCAHGKRESADVLTRVTSNVASCVA